MWCWRWWCWLVSVAAFVCLHICDGRIAIVLALVVVEVGIGGVSIVCVLVVAGSSFSRWREQLNMQSIQARTHLFIWAIQRSPKCIPTESLVTQKIDQTYKSWCVCWVGCCHGVGCVWLCISKKLCRPNTSQPHRCLQVFGGYAGSKIATPTHTRRHPYPWPSEGHQTLVKH